MSTLAMKKKGSWILRKHINYMFKYLYKVDFVTDK